MYDGHYDTARNVQSEIGSPYGYDVYETLGVQSELIGSTGATSQENISQDTMSALMTSRALSVNENELTDTFGDFYQTGTYGNGELSKFANLFATSIQEAGMVGREDEQLEVLESINTLLDRNLTTITESQYESALGLYSLFSSSNQALSGEKSASLVDTLNNAMTGGNNTMDIALGKYSGKYTSLWEFEKQKEKGVTDPENLSSIIDYFEKYASLDLNTDIGKFTLQKFLQSNGADLSTEEIEEIVKNLDSIRSGEYSETFKQANEGSEGRDYIEKQYSDYESSKLEDINTYNAESLNAQERIGDAVNEATSVLKSLYNYMPQWLQNSTGLTSGLVGGVTSAGINIGSQWLGNKLFGVKIKGKGGTGSSGSKGGIVGSLLNPKPTEEFTSYVDDLVDAYNSGGNVDDILKKMSKGGNVTDDMYDWADKLSDAMNKGSGNVDDLINKGYKSYGKNFTRNLASGSDDILSGAGKGASKLAKAGKWLGIAGTALEVGTTVYDTYQATKQGDNRKAVSEVGGGVGSIAGGWGGATLGATIGTAILPVVGTAIGGILGGILGGMGGNKVGEMSGEAIYDASSDELSFTDEQKLKIQDYYDEVSRLYETKGNNSAQDYTQSVIAPYLKSIGVSESKVDDYNTDVGRPDFMKDVENGYFGVMGEVSSSTDNNTSALESNTEAINELRNFYNMTNNTSVKKTTETNTTPVNSTTTSSSSSFMPLSNYSLKNSILNSLAFNSHAVGADYIPYDGYLAELHKGETVLDAHSAEEYRSSKTSGNSYSSPSVLEIKLSGSISGMTNENQNKVVTAIVNKIKDSNSLMEQLAFNTVRFAN